MNKAGNAPHVIQNFVYSSTAKKTISLTFDDGTDAKATRLFVVRRDDPVVEGLVALR